MSCEDRVLPKPGTTTYLQVSSESKTIDLVNLCRRLGGEFQYHFAKYNGNLFGLEKFESAISNQDVFKVIKEKIETALPEVPGVSPRKEDVLAFFNRLPVTRYGVRSMVGGPSSMNIGGVKVEVTRLEPKGITAKDFKYIKSTPEGCPKAANLTGEELRRIYWRLRMRCAFAPINGSVKTIIEELKKQKYVGLLLPNGKVVPFEALHFASFVYVPKELNLIEYYVLPEHKACGHPGDPANCCGPMNGWYPPSTIEEMSQFQLSPQGELICVHTIMALNLPETDAQGNFGRLMIIDPACAKLGMKGRNGDFLYWGYSEDYVKAFPARTIDFYEGNMDYRPYFTFRDDEHEIFCCMGGPQMASAALANLKLDSCGYCGDVARRIGGVETKLKRCTRCMKVCYCDALCQKMAWKGHKLECKPQ